MGVKVRFPRGTQSLAIGDVQINVVDGIADIPAEHVAMLLNHRDDLQIVEDNDDFDRDAYESAQEAEAALRAAAEARRLGAERRAAVILQASTDHYNATHSQVAVPMVNELIRDVTANTDGDGSEQDDGEYEDEEEEEPKVPAPPAAPPAKPAVTPQPAKKA